MTLEEFKNKLADGMEAHGVPTYHATATPEDTCPVLCWQETGFTHSAGDDHVVANVVQVQLDLFTDTEYDPSPENLEALLNTMQVSWFTDGQTYDSDRDEWDRVITVMFLGGG